MISFLLSHPVYLIFYLSSSLLPSNKPFPEVWFPTKVSSSTPLLATSLFDLGILYFSSFGIYFELLGRVNTQLNLWRYVFYLTRKYCKTSSASERYEVHRFGAESFSVANDFQVRIHGLKDYFL